MQKYEKTVTIMQSNSSNCSNKLSKIALRYTFFNFPSLSNEGVGVAPSNLVSTICSLLSLLVLDRGFFLLLQNHIIFRFSERGNFTEEAQAGLTGMGGGFDPR